MTRLKFFSKTFGLHPLTALLLFVVDWMLFGEELATGGIGWVLSLPVGILLGLVAIQIQKRMYKDEHNPAVAKGLVVAILTAIPAPLSSLGLLPLAAFGAIKVLLPDRRQLDGRPSMGVPPSFDVESAREGAPAEGRPYASVRQLHY